MKQYFDINCDIPRVWYTANNGKRYNILQIIEASPVPDIYYIYTFDNVTKYMIKPATTIQYWMYPTDIKSTLSRYYRETCYLYLNKNQFVLKTCYEVE